jgi:hypothetical protein
MPGADFFSQFLDDWLKYPKGAIAAALFGLMIGFVLSRMRYHAKFEALEVRITHKDDLLKFKDDTIESLNAKPKPKPRGRAKTQDSAPDLAPLSEPITPPDLGAALFLENQKIIKAITGTRFRFVFNPQNEQSKILTFNPDYTIGEGRNANEATWRTMNGSLEIYNSDGQVYSRFTLLSDGKSLHHTNQSDTLSIRGQYMVPVGSYLGPYPRVQG